MLYAIIELIRMFSSVELYCSSISCKCTSKFGVFVVQKYTFVRPKIRGLKSVKLLRAFYTFVLIKVKEHLQLI